MKKDNERCQSGKHTPGPYSRSVFEETDTIRRVQFVNKQNRAALWVQHDNTEEGRANERLALAAPDMLEALELAHNLLHLDSDGLRYQCEPYRCVIRAAIAKAKGTNP